MFRKRTSTPISESLSQTRPVRYDTGPNAVFRRLDSSNTLSEKFGTKGRIARSRADAPASPKKAAARNSSDATPINYELVSAPEDTGEDIVKAEKNGSENEAVTDAIGTLGQLNGSKDLILQRVVDLIDAQAASKLTRDEFATEFGPIMSMVLKDLRISLNRVEQAHLEAILIDEMMGYGPLEPLLADPTVCDILVNGPDQVYVERNGRLEESDVQFRDDDHIMQVASRIVTAVGRRIDQTTPLCDARLEDGSRVNVVIPPLMPHGPVISIRKFSAKPLTLDTMVKQENMSPAMAVFLKAAAASRLNLIVSGGTGSGKTTMLNALSRLIDDRERIITIEDAAELQLQQRHVLTMETRPANLEGVGEVTIRDLTINALRMRPDRIILGEIRGPECLDMLQAMNTGHEGSMCTLHANRPREALTRMENMAVMSGVNYPLGAIRTQIVEAIDVIVQVSRMRDGMRRVVSITEIVGMEGDVVTTQELFKFRYTTDDAAGRMLGVYEHSGLRPASYEKLRNYGFDRVVMEAMQ